MSDPISWKVVGEHLLQAAIGYAVNVVTNKLFGKKPKSGKINPMVTAVDSTAVIPTIYGCRKTGGNLIWESTAKKNCKRIITFCSGKINRIYGVCFNNLLAVTGPVLKIKNTLYPDASVAIVPTSFFSEKDKLLILRANGQSTTITLCHSNDSGKEGIKDYNYDVAALTRHINELGNGWVIIDPVFSSNPCEDIHTIEATECYNKTVDFIVDGFKKCSYTAYLGDGEQQIDSRVPGDTQAEKAKLVGGLKYDAYIAITAELSDKLQAGFNVTAIIEGKIVRVFTTPTTYTEQYSANPAWCILDYQTSYDACGVDDDHIDIPKYIEAAPYFADPARNWSINLLLNDKQARQETLNEMFFACRSYPTYQKGKHGILVDKPEPVSQVFDILPTDELEFAWEDEIERLDIKYADPDADWQMIPARAESATFRKDDPVKKEIEADAITNHQQASQLAWFHQNQYATCPLTARYKTNLRARNRSVGDVIETNDPIMELQNKKWRVMGTTEPQGMTVELTLKEYNEALYTDQLGSAKPIVNVSTLSNPADSPPEVSDVVVSQTYYRLKDATIVSYIDGSCTLPEYQFFGDAIVEYSEDNGHTWTDNGKLNLDGKFRINNAKTGVNYLIKISIRNKMGVLSDGVVIGPIYITGKDNPPSDVTGLTVTQDVADSTKLIITCDPVTDIDFKALDIKINDEQLEPIYGFSHVYTIKASGAYTVRVRALDWSNNPSKNAATYTIDVQIEPSDVVGFRAVQNGGNVLFSWPKRPEADVVGIEIREGPTFEYGSLIVTGYAETIYQTPISLEGLHRYHAKAINRAGKYSKNAVSFTVNVSNLPERNIILSYNEIDLRSGTHINTMFDVSAINCLTLPGKCSDYAGIKCNQIGGQSVLKLTKSEPGFYTSPFMPIVDMLVSGGRYVTDIKDVGEVITASLSARFSSNSLIDESVSSKLQYRTSADGTNFTDWQDFIPVTATFQYIQFAADLSTRNYIKSPEVSLFIEEIDLDETPKSGMATIPVGGAYIEYGYAYHDLRTFQPTAIGEGLYADLVSVDNQKAFVKVKRVSDDVDVGGQVTWSSNGI